MTEEMLLRRIGKQDVRALETAIDRYNPYVSAIITAMLGKDRQEDIEELVSDVFLSLWEHAGAVTPGKLRPWLGANARNRAKSFLRKKQLLSMDLDEIPALSAEETPENRLLRQEQSRLVRQAVLSMPQPDREIFLRYYYYLQTSGQIGREMGMEAGTIRMRLMRGRNMLRNTLCKEEVL